MSRISAVQNLLRAKKISGLIMSNLHDDVPNPNIFYFLGAPANGLVVIPAARPPLLFLSPLEEAPDVPARIRRYSSRKNLSSLLKKELRGAAIGVDTTHCTAQTYLALKRLTGKKLVPASDLVDTLRSVKSPEEIRIMEKACGISDAILASCIQKCSSFTTEKDVEEFLIAETKKKGCELSFPPIVASGAHAACPHYHAKAVKLARGFCVLDFGVRYRGYCTDTTRTIFIGSPTQHERDVYDRLRIAQELLIAQSVPGTQCGALHEKAVSLLGPFAKYFIHSLGHGVGLEIHEAPGVGAPSKTVLKKNMVITIEPGIYLPNEYGIRIEDTILVGNEPRSLTRISKELITID